MTDDTPEVEPTPTGMEPVSYGTLKNADGHPRQCTAPSSRSGTRCLRWAIAGGTVCPTHGGATPRVKERARLRLQELVEPAVARLATEMMQADKSSDRQRAANSILDRAGFGRAVKVEAEDAREMLVDLLIAAAGEAEGNGK